MQEQRSSKNRGHARIEVMQQIQGLDTHISRSTVLQVRTPMAQTRSFPIIGPSLWNALPSSLHITILSRSLPALFSLLKIFLYTWGSCTGSATEWPLLFSGAI